MVFRLFVGLFASMGFFGILNMDACGMTTGKYVPIERANENEKLAYSSGLDFYCRAISNRLNSNESISAADNYIAALKKYVDQQSYVNASLNDRLKLSKIDQLIGMLSRLKKDKKQ